MCGLIGCFGEKAGSVSLVNGLEKLLDRGPDSNNIETPNEFLVLGAARLAMTDPHERSNQPFSKNGDWLVFNGEIYNFKQVRERIVKEFGVNFVTNSDTEVLIEVLRLYGVKGIGYLQGMFAFAYFNGRDKNLFLARDSLGKKPLYYLKRNNKVYWASTIPALREICRDKEINLDSVVTYLCLGYTIDSETVYSSISSVKPGYCYKIHEDGQIQEFPVVKFDLNQFEVELDLSSTLRRAVVDRIDEHDQVAVSLSGGLDSTIVAMLGAETGKKVAAFSLHWSDSDKKRYNEDYRAAEIIARNLGIEFIGVDFSHYNTPISEYIKKFLIFMGEPNSNPTGISLLPLYETIADKGFRLLLTGDGADEIFGGYPRYSSKILKPRMRMLSDRATLAVTKAAPQDIEKAILRFANADYPGLWTNFHWNFRPRDLSHLLSKKLKRDSSGIAQLIFKKIRNVDSSNRVAEHEILTKIMAKDLGIWLTNESNRKLDRISMAYSIEARSPFQDERVIDIGRDLMFKSGYNKLNKKILWETYPNLSKIGVRSDKAGFISPVGHWLRSNPDLIHDAFEALDSSSIFDSEKLYERKSDQFTGDFGKIRQLWSLVILGHWFRVQD